MPNTYFNAHDYLARYGDLSAAGIAPEHAWQHYVQFGAAEGRMANPWFDTGYYGLANPDLVAAGVPPYHYLAHYLRFGATEGRRPAPWFDASHYAATYADLRDAFSIDDPYALSGEQAAALARHFINHGLNEQRTPAADAAASPARLAAYAAANPDLLGAFDIHDVNALTPAQQVALARHFYTFGLREERPQPPMDFSLAPGDNLALTTLNGDIINGTERDDLITGESSALTAQRTLQPHDQIDGQGGHDTLRVLMDADFNGFTTGAGYLRNVDTVELINQGGIARAFNATGISGTTTYKLLSEHGAAIHLTALAATGITVHLQGQRDAVTHLGFAADAASGGNDHINLALHGIGTAQQSVEVQANGIETVHVQNVGDNHIDLEDAASRSITVAGAGSLRLDGVAATLATLNASQYAGAAHYNLYNSNTLADIVGGSGHDTFAVNAGGRPNTRIDGGLGQNTLVVQGTGAAHYTVDRVQTLRFETYVGDISYVAASTTGVQTVEMGIGSGHHTQLVGLGNTDLALNWQGYSGSAAAITLDHQGTTAVRLQTQRDPADTAPQLNVSQIRLPNTSAVAMDIAQGIQYAGVLYAPAALDVLINVSGQLGLDINNPARLWVHSARSVALNNAEHNGYAKLAAEDAALLSIATDAHLGITGASDLSSVEQLLAAVGPGGLAIDAALPSLHRALLAGTGNATLGDLGHASLPYDMAVHATGLHDLTIGNVRTNGHDYHLALQGVTGAVSQGAIDVGSGTVRLELGDINGPFLWQSGSAGSLFIDAQRLASGVGQVAINQNGTSFHVHEQLSFIGSATLVNELNITATGPSLHAQFNGGLLNDTLTIKPSGSGPQEIVVNGDFGRGSNTVSVDASGTPAGYAHDLSINVSGAKQLTKAVIYGGNGNDVIVGSDGNDAITGGHGTDFLTGGAGSDLFVFDHGDSIAPAGSGASYDVLLDFTSRTDKIQLPRADSRVNFYRLDIGALPEDDIDRFIFEAISNDLINVPTWSDTTQNVIFTDSHGEKTAFVYQAYVGDINGLANNPSTIIMLGGSSSTQILANNLAP